MDAGAESVGGGGDAPLYRRLADALISAINSGGLRRGQRLPGVRELSRHHRVSLATVLAAYRCLEAEGWVEVRPRSGHYVRNAPSTRRPTRSMSEAGGESLAGAAERVYREFDLANRPGIVPFGAACPAPSFFPLGSMQRLMARVARRHPDATGTYSQDAFGHPGLRAAISLRMFAQGYEVKPDEIIVTNGCTEAINLALRATTRPGDVVAVESPTYCRLLKIVESLGLRALEIPSHPRDGISLDALELATRPPNAVKACVLVPNFSNPLAALMPTQHKAEAVRLLRERGIPVIEDDVFGELGFTDTRPPLMKRWDRDGGVLVCSSFSKTLAPGLRVGWLIPGRFLAQALSLKVQSSVSTSTLPQLTIAAFLESGGVDRHLRQLRYTMRRQVQRTVEIIRETFPKGTAVNMPEGGYLLWVSLPEEVDGDEMARLALERGIGITPGSLFTSLPKARHCVRINCGCVWNEKVERSVAILGRIAHSMAKTVS